MRSTYQAIIARAGRLARRHISPEWQQAYRAVAYRGSRFYCPCCGRTARRFRRSSSGATKNSRCPWCGSHERHRLLWLYLQREVVVQDAQLRLLHVAPEALAQRLKVRSNIRYVGFDIAPAREPDVLGDLTSTPFASGAFDLILCSHVLEHIQDDYAAAREIARMLSPTGHAVVLVPLDEGRANTDEDPTVVDPAERIRRFGQRNHVRLYGRDFANRLASCGLQVEQLDYAARLGSHEREHMLLGNAKLHREQLFICHTL